MKKYNIAIVGATGLVGRTAIKLLKEYDLPIDNIKLFASEKSIGKEIEVLGKLIKVQRLEKGCFKGIDYAFFSAGGKVSEEFAPIAINEGAIVIDNSSTWRMHDECALIVPEINFEDYKTHNNIIANPNCSTIQCVLPLKPLDDYYHLNRIVYTTYQATSGSGQKGIDDLRRCKNGEMNQFYPYDISRTCIPEIDVAFDNLYTKEEMKMVNETRKILHHNEIKIAATCIRVPVERAHGVVINARFDKKPDLNKVRELLSNTPGIKLLDDLKNHIYPVSTLAYDNDLVYVGRIREDLSDDNSIIFYTVSDNIRKGAAANGIQIVKRLIQEKEHESM